MVQNVSKYLGYFLCGNRQPSLIAQLGHTGLTRRLIAREQFR